jgi:glycosyltransferase involved in cell wall biosynthesis
MKLTSFICVIIFTLSTALVALEEKKIVVIITSYNNALYYKQNLDSVFSQKYDNFTVIYVDDCSPDGTGTLVEEFIKEYGQSHRIKLIRNENRQRAMANVYKAIHLCDDHAIVIILNGDDWLAHDQVLTKINEAYAESDILLTYGNYRLHPEGIIGTCCSGIPQEIIQKNAYREYAWLFKSIKREDFLYEGQFLPMTYDQAMMLPLLEISGGKFKFINEVLYIYNNTNPISDGRVNWMLQERLATYIRQRPKYTAKKAPESIGIKRQ